MLVKNTFGVSAVLGYRQSLKLEANAFFGSALNRKPLTLDQKKSIKNRRIQKAQKDGNTSTPSTWIDMETGEEISGRKPRTMSQRTRSKIRNKIIVLSRLCATLTFVTLTFVNAVSDQTGVYILKKFLDNMKKQFKDFQYLWVAERQAKNKVFKDNIHFHIITNRRWDIKKTWKYWKEAQAKCGIIPRDENFKPGSAFDVRPISSADPRKIINYVTKYVTKNKANFDCQVWNCSQGISNLFTGFYSDMEFLNELYKLKGDQITQKALEWSNLHFIPVDNATIPKYDRITVENKKHFNK